MLIGFVQFQGKINFILAYNKRIKRHIKFFSLTGIGINGFELRLTAVL